MTEERGANLANSHLLPAAQLCSGHGNISLLNTAVTSSSAPRSCRRGNLMEGAEKGVEDGKGVNDFGGADSCLI